ncbi:MAG TPA: hypothetical protein VFO94_20995, partial [Gammaproteobacteria bacterium]|nr:hypothetical protein [Gammaproteobacteria bacterium]
ERAVTRYYELTVRLRRAQHRAFEQQVPDARVIELPGAKHHVFISNEGDVLAAVQNFVDGLVK